MNHMVINVKRRYEKMESVRKYCLKIPDGLSDGHLLQSQTQVTFFVIGLLHKISVNILKSHHRQNDCCRNGDYFFSRWEYLFQVTPNKFQKGAGEICHK